MTPDVVVDIGNSRIKWGRVRSGQVDESIASLPGDRPEAWDKQVLAWALRSQLSWAVAGVQPQWQEEFLRWAEPRGDRVREIVHEHIPIPIEVEEPEAVGIDRLLNAFAASRLKPVTFQAIVISVGTAVTVDLVRENGAFAGGAIFPGPRLMAESLHRFTAKLPLVTADKIAFEEAPGTNTRTAIETGIAYAILGGASRLAEATSAGGQAYTWVLLTGGALGDMAGSTIGQFAKTLVCPTLTLEGIRIAAEALP